VNENNNLNGWSPQWLKAEVSRIAGNWESFNLNTHGPVYAEGLTSLATEYGMDRVSKGLTHAIQECERRPPLAILRSYVEETPGDHVTEHPENCPFCICGSGFEYIDGSSGPMRRCRNWKTK
jgi:hypothetical protein